MDKHEFNEGLKALQMAFREPINSETCAFYLRFINSKANPTNDQWDRAVNKLIVAPIPRLPPLGRILQAVQEVQAEDASRADIKERQIKLADLTYPETEEDRRRIIETFIKPITGKWDKMYDKPDEAETIATEGSKP